MRSLCRHAQIILAFVSAVFAVGVVQAATIVIQNNDGANEGFNDPTPVSPVGGNSGTTLGQQRLNVFANAAAVWGQRLDSNVTIVVEANFDPLTCSSSQAVLGSAGTTTVHRNFFNAPAGNTYYHAALANSLAGSDLNGSTPDIAVTFNSSIDNNNNCLNNTNWYYGLDGNPPGGTMDLRTVVLHELGHGLGFTTFVNVSTGERFLNRNDTYMLNLEDHSLGLAWSSMTNAQRAASAIDTGDLHWSGANLNANSGVLTSGVSGGHVRMYAPNPVKTGSSVSHFDSALSPNELMEPSNIGTHSNLGLAIYLMQDVGWVVLPAPNTAPTISAIADQMLDEDNVSAPIGFTVGDAETAAVDLNVTAVSSNQAVVSNAGLALGGSGANRTLTITPQPDANGTSTITVTVSDSELKTDEAFLLTVNAVNDPPVVTISAPADGSVHADTSTINFIANASDVEDGSVAASVQWNSDIDGYLGTGENLMTNLSLGTHSITASVTDSGSAAGNDQITVTVNPDWDMDGDGMADSWEMANFGTLDRDGTGDYDNDGISDLQEYLNSLATGDINNNGSVDAGDVILGQRHILGGRILTAEELSRGDLYPPNGADGVFDMSDLILLKQRVLNGP